MIVSNIQRNIDGTIGYMGDFWTLTAASEQVDHPAANLFNPDLNLKWVSWGQRASHSWIEVMSDNKNTYRRIAIAGLFGIDRTNPSRDTSGGTFSPNTRRIIVDSLYPVASRRRPPVVAVTLTNLTGDLSILNGPVDPPNIIPTGYASTKMSAASDAVNTILKADFANHNATERPLASGLIQTIRAHYVHSTSPAAIPALTFQLRFNGVEIGSEVSTVYDSSLLIDDDDDMLMLDDDSLLLLETAPFKLVWIERTSEGYMFNLLVDTAALPSLVGQLGIKITGATTGTSTPLPIGLEWIAELNYDGNAWDSGSEDIKTFQIVSTPDKITRDGIEPNSGYEIYADETVWVYIEPSDWMLYGASEETTGVPLGGFQGQAFYAGRLVVAEGLSIGLLQEGGYARRKLSDVSTLRTRGGTLRGTRNALHWDEHDFHARLQSQTLIATDLDVFFENAGMRNPVVFIPDEAEPNQAVYGILSRWEVVDAGAQIEPEMNIDDAEPYYRLEISAIDAQARRTLR